MEILAAAAILAIVLVPLFRLHLQSLAMAESTGFYSRAPWLAQMKLNAAIGGDGLRPGNDEGRFEGDTAGWRWQVDIASALNGPLKASADRLFRIDVTIISADASREYRLRRYLLGAPEK